MRQFFKELKRRKVYRTAVVYGVVAFGVWQVADISFPALGLPDWTLTFVVVLGILGFPIALVLAWAFQVTPEGVRRSEFPETQTGAGRMSSGGWIVTALVLVFAGGVVWWSWGPGGPESKETSGTAADTGAVRTATSVADTAGPSRIAVLPFENIAPDTSDAFFAEGMHEETLNQLAKVSGLEVISRTSVMQYADTDKAVPQISEELGGVSALLEGTVRRAGDQVRITAQLIDAPEDVHLWSETYDRELSVDAIFDIQADIAEQIAGALEARWAKESDSESRVSRPKTSLHTTLTFGGELDGYRGSTPAVPPGWIDPSSTSTRPFGVTRLSPRPMPGWLMGTGADTCGAGTTAGSTRPRSPPTSL